MGWWAWPRFAWLSHLRTGLPITNTRTCYSPGAKCAPLAMVDPRVPSAVGAPGRRDGTRAPPPPPGAPSTARPAGLVGSLLGVCARWRACLVLAYTCHSLVAKTSMHAQRLSEQRLAQLASPNPNQAHWFSRLRVLSRTEHARAHTNMHTQAHAPAHTTANIYMHTEINTYLCTPHGYPHPCPQA